MSYTVDTTVTVQADHTVTITVPDDFPPGEVRLMATFVQKGEGTTMTAREFAQSEFFGMWADRDDLPHTNEEFINWRKSLGDRTGE